MRRVLRFLSSSASSLAEPASPPTALSKHSSLSDALKTQFSSPRSATPKEIVAVLDSHIVGQNQAKRAIALALRNRWRRQQLPPGLKEKIKPKHILMTGPTGVGKTELARCMADFLNAPFVKVEATRYSEVGFHGKDVDSIIEDLVKLSVNLTKRQLMDKHREEIKSAVEDRIVANLTSQSLPAAECRHKLRHGQLESAYVVIDVNGMRRGMEVREAVPLMEQEAFQKMFPPESIIRTALNAVEQDGIVFVDEIDKIAQPATKHHAQDASDEGVQRDLLPLLDGCTVSTKLGEVDTRHILFIAAGSFHAAKPSDLISELQGRLPIRVDLAPLSQNDLLRVLTEPQHALVTQHKALLKTEGINLIFAHEALELIAAGAAQLNASLENIGARRLHTIMEAVLDDMSYNAPDAIDADFVVTRELVETVLARLLSPRNFHSYLL